MTKIDVSDPTALGAAVEKYLRDFPGDLICALQLWYEGLGGQGAPGTAETALILDAIGRTSGWKDAGNVRYEKYGIQKSFKRA